MKDIHISGIYKPINKVTIRPDKRCINCPFFDEGLGWCTYLKVKVEDSEYNKECPIIVITIEEE